MIKLEVEGYCHQCSDFSSDVVKPEKFFVAGDLNGGVGQSDTIVRCEHRRRCEAIRRYLELKMNEVSG